MRRPPFCSRSWKTSRRQSKVGRRTKVGTVPVLDGKGQLLPVATITAVAALVGANVSKTAIGIRTTGAVAAAPVRGAVKAAITMTVMTDPCMCQ